MKVKENLKSDWAMGMCKLLDYSSEPDMKFVQKVLYLT